MTTVDMRSDTVTRPTSGMWDAMRSAELGDDVLGDDPTVQALQVRAAEMLGKEAALFVPSGTMANQIAIRLHTQPGDAIIMEATAHPFNYEAAGAAMISGVQTRTLPGVNGILDPADIASAFPKRDPHCAPTRLLTVEDTANRGGGTPHPIATLDALAQEAHSRGAATHLDGARLFNAAVATDTDASRRVRDYDTVSICLSKGLGAPVGSVLAGPADLMDRALWVRKALGGGMRQAGVIAAAGLYALEHHVTRLADDHARASRLAEALAGLGYPTNTPLSNMLYVQVADGPAAQDLLDAKGVRCLSVSKTELRLVTHIDVDDGGIAHSISAFAELSEQMRPRVQGEA